MSDYPVTLLAGLNEYENFAETGLPPGVRSVDLDSTSNPLIKQGIFKVIQIFILVLLKTPGTDIFSPDSGGDLRKIVSRPVGERLVNTRRGEIGLSVSRTEDQILESQTGVTLPPEERLQSATLRTAEFDFENQAWNIVVRLVTDAGGAADVLL
jgi:hypothetical protein